MLEAGWLLLLLFLGVCSLFVVACMWPSFRRATQLKTIDEAHAFKGKAPATPKYTQAESAAQAVGQYLRQLLRYAGWWIARLGEEEMDKNSDALYMTLSAEEIGQVAALIIKKVARSKAIHSMPRYTKRQHAEYAAFYEQLKESMERALGEE